MGDFDTAAAIAQANKWTVIGRELVMAMFELDKRIDMLSGAGFPRRELVEGEPRAEMTRAMDEAVRTLSGAREDINQSLYNWCDRMISDAQPVPPLGTSEGEWSAHLATCAAIEAGVISVGGLIKKMEMEA